MKTQIVFFDAGGTLVYPDPSVGEVYYSVARDYGIDAGSPETASRAFTTAWRNMRAGGSGIADKESARRWWRQQVEQCFALLGHREHPDMDRLFDDLFRHFGRASAWKTYDDVAETLHAVGGLGLRMGLLSNWDYRLRDILCGLGLLEHLDPVIISFEIGHEKPLREIYRIACERARVAPSEALVVGDSYEEDVEAPRALGMQAVLLDREGRYTGDGAIRRLTEIVGLIA